MTADGLITAERIAISEWLRSDCPCHCIACTLLREKMEEIRKLEALDEARR